MALTSPGVEVSVINESFYVPSDAGTTPLFIVASAQDKDNGAGDGTAVGTQTANANTVYLISWREVFGPPKIYLTRATDAEGVFWELLIVDYANMSTLAHMGLCSRTCV